MHPLVTGINFVIALGKEGSAKFHVKVKEEGEGV